MSNIDPAVSGVQAAQQAALNSKIATTIAAKQLQTQEQLGQAAVELLESAAQLSKEAGKGAKLDSQA